MDGFKPVVKMKCGGSVAKAVEKCKGGRMKEGGKVMHDDIKEDKKLIKKAFGMHDDQLHEGKTDLSGLKKGGRCKKTGGTVRKYAEGGLIEAKGKKRPRPMDPPGGVEPDDVPRAPEQAFKKGGKAKKMADGGLTSPVLQAALNADQLRKRRMMQPGMGGPAAAAPAAPVGQPTAQDIAPTPQNIGATTGPIMKRGGKVKK